MWRPSALKWNGAGKCHKGHRRTGRSLAHVLFLSAALSLLSALVRRERRQLVLTARDRRKKVRVAPRRIAASLAFATLFFAGAALSAGAGNGVVGLIDPSSESAATADATTDTTTTTTDRQIPSADRTPTGRPMHSRRSRASRRRAQTSQVASAGQTGQPETPPASQAPEDTASNTNVAGVRSTLKARLHRRAQRSRASPRPHRARPGSAKMVPARLLRPQVPPVVKAVKVCSARARRSSASPRRTSRTSPPPCGCTATYRIRRRPRAV